MASEADRLARRALKDPDPAGVLRGHLKESARRRSTSRDRSAGRKAAVSERKAQRRERLAAVRPIVFARAGGLCQAWGCLCHADDLHHGLSGPLRRQHEDPSHLFALCRDHHRRAHDGDRNTLDGLAAYAVAHGMTDAARHLARRIAKAEDSRASRGEP